MHGLANPIYPLSQLSSYSKRLLSSSPGSRASVLGVLPRRSAPATRGPPGRISAYALGHGPARPPPPLRDRHPLTGPRCSRRLGGSRREKRARLPGVRDRRGQVLGTVPLLPLAHHTLPTPDRLSRATQG